MMVRGEGCGRWRCSGCSWTLGREVGREVERDEYQVGLAVGETCFWGLQPKEEGDGR